MSVRAAADLDGPPIYQPPSMMACPQQQDGVFNRENDEGISPRPAPPQIMKVESPSHEPTEVGRNGEGAEAVVEEGGDYTRMDEVEHSEDDERRVFADGDDGEEAPQNGVGRWRRGRLRRSRH